MPQTTRRGVAPLNPQPRWPGGYISPCCGKPGHRRRPSRTVWRGYAGSSQGIRAAGAGTWAGPKSRHSWLKRRNAQECPIGKSSRRATPWNCTTSSSGASR